MFWFGSDKYNIGDVLVCSKGMFKHFGIYVGNGKVIHFASDSQGELLNPYGAVVKKTSLRQFSYGDDIYVKNSADSMRLPVNQIVSNSESQIGSDLGGYSQLNNNSEHFARWCETGQITSERRNDIANGLSTVVKGLVELFGKS